MVYVPQQMKFIEEEQIFCLFARTRDELYFTSTLKSHHFSSFGAELFPDDSLRDHCEEYSMRMTNGSVGNGAYQPATDPRLGIITKLGTFFGLF